MNRNLQKGIYESFAKFFETPTREQLRDLLKANFGESDWLDFKETWPAFTKVAKHILAIANSGGGCIVLGIAQKDDGTLQPKGLETFSDKSEIEKGLRRFLPEAIKYEVLDFNFEATEYDQIKGKKFQVVIVEDDPKKIPFISKENGDGIRKSAIYIRRGTNSEEVTYEELQLLINRRIETGYSSTPLLVVQNHVEQLKYLYSQLQEYRQLDISDIHPELTEEFVKNENYPKENFEQFICRVIVEKQKLIHKILEIEVPQVNLRSILNRFSKQ